MKQKPPLNIYQNRNGINFIDGYYLVRNPKNRMIALLSIAQGIASIHEVKSQMSLQELIARDANGHFDVFDTLKLGSKEKKQKQRNDD